MPLDVVVLFGSVRSDRQGIRAARFITSRVGERGHAVTLVDPMERRLPLLDRMYKEHPKGEAPAVMEELAALYLAADAFVIVSGEYNHGIPPALKNLLDHFLEEYLWRPSGIVSYSAGSFGGVRAAMQLRMTLGEIGMPSVSSTLPVPKVHDAFDEEGRPADQAWLKRADRFLDDLFFWAEAGKARREAVGTPF